MIAYTEFMCKPTQNFCAQLLSFQWNVLQNIYPPPIFGKTLYIICNSVKPKRGTEQNEDYFLPKCTLTIMSISCLTDDRQSLSVNILHHVFSVFALHKRFHKISKELLPCPGDFIISEMLKLYFFFISFYYLRNTLYIICDIMSIMHST